MSHATAIWLGLVKVLCQNKAPKIKRQVVSVSKKAKEPSNSNNNNFLSELQHPPKEKYPQMVRVKQQQDKVQIHSHIVTGEDIAEASQLTGR